MTTPTRRIAVDPDIYPQHKTALRWRRQLVSYDVGRLRHAANVAAREAAAAERAALPLPERIPDGMPEDLFRQEWKPTTRPPKDRTPREIEIDAIRDAARQRLLDRERAEFKAHQAKRQQAEEVSRLACAASAAQRKKLAKKRENAARKSARRLKHIAAVRVLSGR